MQRIRRPVTVGGVSGTLGRQVSFDEGWEIPESPSPAQSERRFSTYSYVTLQPDCVHYESHDFVGSGAFGRVYKALWRGGRTPHLIDNDTVAVKQLNKDIEPEDIFEDNKEAALLASLSHQNVVKFYGVTHNERRELLLVTEYCEGGSLYSHLAQRPIEKNISRTLEWALHIAQGVEYLHIGTANPIVHRDLKSQNILISSNHVLKICDFGSSVRTTDKTLMSQAGTEAWMAPEMLKAGHGVYGIAVAQQVDIYSLAVIFWELMTHERPFANFNGSIMWLVGRGKLTLTIPEEAPDEMKQLMADCFSYDPESRPRASTVVYRLRQIVESDGGELQDFLRNRDTWLGHLHEDMEIDLISAQRQADEEDGEPTRHAQALRSERTTNAFLRFWVFVLLLMVLGLLAPAHDAAIGREALNVYRKSSSADSPMNMSQLEDALVTLAQKKLLQQDTVDDAVRIMESYNWHDDLGLDEAEFVAAVATERSPYGMARRYLSWILRISGVHSGSIGSILRQLRQTYGGRVLGGCAVTALSVSMLLLWQLSNSMLSVLPQTKNEVFKSISIGLLLPVGTIVMSATLVEEVSGVKVVETSLWVLILYNVIFQFLTWMLRPTEPVAPPADSTPSSPTHSTLSSPLPWRRSLTNS